jgi:ABC-type Fe3+-siderophore transport system permease subunit
MIFRCIVRFVALSAPAYLALSLLSYPDHEPLMIATSILFGWFFVLFFLLLARTLQEPQS